MIPAPLPCFIGLSIENAPVYAKFVSWEGLQEWERKWFDARFPCVSNFDDVKRYEWERSVIRKLMTERDALHFVSCKCNISSGDECGRRCNISCDDEWEDWTDLAYE